MKGIECEKGKMKKKRKDKGGRRSRSIIIVICNNKRNCYCYCLFVAATEDNTTNKERKRSCWELLALKLTAFQLFTTSPPYHSFSSKI